jgi:hypothetical protein
MPDMKADGYKVKAQGLPAVPPSALHPAGEEPRDWVFTEALCAGGVQVRYVHTRHPSSPYGKPYCHFYKLFSLSNPKPLVGTSPSENEVLPCP